MKRHSIYEKKCLLVILFCTCVINNYGQDAHYWNLSYGTNASLLGGAVIGSVSDLSAAFYNPGMENT